MTNPLRVAVIGDSFALGVGVEVDDTFGARLERLLNLNSGVRPAEVKIFARCGVSTHQELDLLNQALTWKPEIVVLSVCLNDAEDWRDPTHLMRLRERIFHRKPPRALAWLVAHSRFAKAVYGAAERVRSRHAYLRYYRAIYEPSYPGWKAFCEAVGAFKAQCDAHGAKLVAMVFPLLGTSLRRGQYPFEEIHQRISGVMAEHNIPCLDLLPAFTGVDNIRVEVVPEIDEHPNEIAHRIAATELLSFLLKTELLDACYRPRVFKQRMAHRIWRRVRQRQFAS